MMTMFELTLSSSRLKKSTNVGSLFSPIKIPFSSNIALLTNGNDDASADELSPLVKFSLFNFEILLAK